MPRTRILIIDFDTRLVQATRELLIKQNFEVNALSEFKDTRFLKEANYPHLIVLDVMTPGQNGFEIVRRIRSESQIPILIATERNDVMDRLTGLEAGADDYLAKPYEPRELVLRIRAILRRGGPQLAASTVDAEPREWRFKGLVIQSNRRRVVLDGQPVELTTAEFDLLRLMASNHLQVLSREVILDQLRGIEWEAVDRSIDILVSRLRDKLRDDPRRPRFIRTVRSVGYQFVAEPDTNGHTGNDIEPAPRMPV